MSNQETESFIPYIDVTGEAILNPNALPEPIRHWTRVRFEYYLHPCDWVASEVGPVYLPPNVDIVKLINTLNGREIYKPPPAPTTQLLEAAKRVAHFARVAYGMRSISVPVDYLLALEAAIPEPEPATGDTNTYDCEYLEHDNCAVVLALKADVDELVNKCLKLNEECDGLHQEVAHANMARELAVKLGLADRERLARAEKVVGMVRMARDELGVVQPEYPMPVAVCAETLDAALAALEGK